MRVSRPEYVLHLHFTARCPTQRPLYRLGVPAVMGEAAPLFFAEKVRPLTGRHEPLRAELKSGDLLLQTTSPSRKATPSMLIWIVQLKTIAMRSTE
jgi:hypothetical protein